MIVLTPNHFVVKFSDDDAILSLLTSNSNITSYKDWCDDHHCTSVYEELKKLC